MSETRIVFSLHAVERMIERDILEAEVRTTLASGETIEVYPDDVPYPCRLVLGWSGSRPVHVVVADNVEMNEVVVVTVYEPDTDVWEQGFRRRRAL